MKWIKKDAAISLLEQDAKIDALTRNIGFTIASGIVLLLGVSLLSIRYKIRKDKLVMRHNEKLYETRHALNQSELNGRKQREEELERELELQNRSLMDYTTNLVQKNSMLEEIKTRVQEVLIKPEIVDSTLKELISRIDDNSSLDKDWHSFTMYFEQVYPDFFKRLNRDFPKLGSTEMKLCALIRLSLNIKESASVLNMSPDSVKVARHRLRKRFGVLYDDKLFSFINAI